MALCAVCGPDTHTDSLAAGRRLRRRKWRPVPARRRRQIGDRVTISSEAGAGKIRKLRCRSGCCRGCSACSNRGRRWASTRSATATSPALRRSTAQVRVPVHPAHPTPCYPYLHELASSFPAPGLLWQGGRHVNAG
jgi:hypothetical protein